MNPTLSVFSPIKQTNKQTKKNTSRYLRHERGGSEEQQPSLHYRYCTLNTHHHAHVSTVDNCVLTCVFSTVKTAFSYSSPGTHSPDRSSSILVAGSYRRCTLYR
jgi:hypothetical protein